MFQIYIKLINSLGVNHKFNYNWVRNKTKQITNILDYIPVKPFLTAAVAFDLHIINRFKILNLWAFQNISSFGTIQLIPVNMIWDKLFWSLEYSKLSSLVMNLHFGNSVVRTNCSTSHSTTPFVLTITCFFLVIEVIFGGISLGSVPPSWFLDWSDVTDESTCVWSIAVLSTSLLSLLPPPFVGLHYAVVSTFLCFLGVIT